MGLVQYQFPLVVLAFLAGSAGMLVLLRKPPDHRLWPLADVLWVVFGLFGALAAVVAEFHNADSSRIARQAEITRAANAEFDRESGRFRLRNCDAPADPALVVLCDKADFLAASTSRNADLPLFIAVAEEASLLRRLDPFAPPKNTPDMAEMAARADAFDPGALLAFQPLDNRTRAALKSLQKTDPAIAGEYRILAQSYEALIAQTDRLQQEWAFLQSRAWLLSVQIVAISLVSFAAPFRLGRAITALKGRGAGDPDQFD